ncbi:prefoldin subunit 3 [Diutina catenulata]
MDYLKPKHTNPRGIPEAPFLEKVDAVIKNASEFEPVMKASQDRLQQYKYMEISKRQQLADLNQKIPDIEKNLAVIAQLREQKETGETMETNYELNDTLYTRAEIDVANVESVCLWLGADVMLEYPLDEAQELLEERLKKNQDQAQIVKEDLEFLKENITTMEVNTARLYNWDVERRKRERIEAK